MNEDFNNNNNLESNEAPIIEESTSETPLIQKTPNGVTRDELEAYVGLKNHPHYSKAIDSYMKNPNSICFNWSAFFFGIYWLLFRKAFVPALVLFAFSFASMTFLPYPIAFIVSASLLLGLAFWGSTIYLKVAEANILKAKARFNANVNITDFNSILMRIGGTSFFIPMIFIISQSFLL